MKTKSIKLLFSTLVMSISLFSCSNDLSFSDNQENNLKKLSKSQKNIIEYADNFGKVHNEGVAFILEAATSETKSMNLPFNPEDTKSFVFSILDKFVNKTTKSYVEIEEYYEELTNEDIRMLMSKRELLYVDEALANYYSPNKLDNLIIDVVSDKELSESQMYATATFISTLKYSAEYWSNNLNQWNETFKKPGTKASWENVITADAFYGWWGTVGTGGNVAIGAGCAVAASVFSAL